MDIARFNALAASNTKVCLRMIVDLVRGSRAILMGQLTLECGYLTGNMAWESLHRRMVLPIMVSG